MQSLSNSVFDITFGFSIRGPLDTFKGITFKSVFGRELNASDDLLKGFF